MNKFNWNYPTTMWVGENRIKDLFLACKNLNIKKPLVVTDKGLIKNKIFLNTLELLKKDNVLFYIYSNVVGNPTGRNVEEGVHFFKKDSCGFVNKFDVFRSLHGRPSISGIFCLV